MITLNSKSKKVASIVLHILVWMFWFAIPFLFSLSNPQGNEPPRNPNFYFFIWIPMSLSLMLFYTNYFWLIERYLFQKKVLWFILINLVLIIGFSVFTDYVRELFGLFKPDMPDMREPRPDGFNEAFKPKPPKNFLFGVHSLTFFFVVSISVAIRTTSRWFVTENQRKNLENENLKSELNNLKMQLNPHFFFNTLNNIYSLIQTSPDKAQESVHGLAKLMRYHLYETNEDKVLLNGEVEFMKSYIALMKLRLSANTEVYSSFSVQDLEVSVAPLLFIPIIENAFKHGISPNEKSIIKITLEEKNHILSFESFNSNFPQKYETDKGGDANGIGLDNIQKRLSLIYPGRYILVKDVVDGLFHIKVVIQL